MTEWVFSSSHPSSTRMEKKQTNLGDLADGEDPRFDHAWLVVNQVESSVSHQLKGTIDMYAD
jgi:hypothetical protein